MVTATAAESSADGGAICLSAQAFMGRKDLKLKVVDELMPPDAGQYTGRSAELLLNPKPQTSPPEPLLLFEQWCR